MNYSNSRARGRQAWPSLYEPDPGARPPPSLTTPPRLARSQDERRSPCAATCTIVGIPIQPVNKRDQCEFFDRKNSVLQIDQGNLISRKTWSVFKHVHLKTARVSMLSRLMIEPGDLLMTQLQHKTTLKYIMRPERSTLTMKHYVKEWRQTWTSKFQDYHIPLWNTRKVPAFDNWFRKLRTTQIDMLFNKIYDRNNHLIPSVQNQNKWFGMLATSNYVNCPRRNPKRSAKYVYHSGTLASSIARAGTSYVNQEVKIRNLSNTRWTFFQFPSTWSRKDDLTDIDMVRSRETGNITRPTSWRRSARRSFYRVCMTDSYKMKHSAIEWLKMVATKMLVDKVFLRTKIILTIWPHKNFTIIKVIGGFVRTRQVPILCQWSADLTSNKHCLPCNNWNRKKDLNEINNGPRVLLLRSWQGSWWTPYSYESHHGDNQVLIEQGDLLYTFLEQIFKAWFSWIHLLC